MGPHLAGAGEDEVSNEGVEGLVHEGNEVFSEGKELSG